MGADLKCPKCGSLVAWAIPSSETTGYAKCTLGAYMINGISPLVHCGWSGKVRRSKDESISLIAEQGKQ